MVNSLQMLIIVLSATTLVGSIIILPVIIGTVHFAITFKGVIMKEKRDFVSLAKAYEDMSSEEKAMAELEERHQFDCWCSKCNSSWNALDTEHFEFSLCPLCFISNMDGGDVHGYCDNRYRHPSSDSAKGYVIKDRPYIHPAEIEALADKISKR